MTATRKARNGLTDHLDDIGEYERDEQARADARFAAWRRRQAAKMEESENE